MIKKSKVRCRECGKEYVRLTSHVVQSHGYESGISYLLAHNILARDPSEMYNEGMSARQIADQISSLNEGVSPIKKDVLSWLRSVGTPIRSTSDAIKEWSTLRGGPWNKGLTKEDHEGIMAYAKKREGKKNGYYTSPNPRIRYWEYKTEEELIEIRRRAGETLRKKYASGELVPKSITDPEWGAFCQQRRLEGYRRWLADGNKVRFGNASKAEQEIAEILEELGVKYARQMSLQKPEGYYYRFDFTFEAKKLHLEYNGTYWHADPRVYDANYYNKKKRKTAKEMWEYDKKKIDRAQKEGYTVAVVWEEDFKILTKQQKKEMINEIIKS